jgi:prepilin-type N-terminal cleavage/methylation domain-containing protein
MSTVGRVVYFLESRRTEQQRFHARSCGCRPSAAAPLNLGLAPQPLHARARTMPARPPHTPRRKTAAALWTGEIRLNRGLTLVELVVTVAISSIILVALMRFLASAYPLSRVVFEQASATETARVQLARITKVLREARESDTGGYPLVATQPQRLIFYADIDVDDATERVRYELSGTRLERGL